MIAAAIVDAARTLIRERLTVGTSGNISVRDGEVVRITPSGVGPESLQPEQIVQVELASGQPRAGRPSSEVGFHLGIYRARADVAAVVHTHSPWATAVSCARLSIPPFHYMMVGTGDGTLDCAPYHPPGSPELAEGVVATLGDRAACLLANHGAVATGPGLSAAMDMAREVESLAQQFTLSRLLGGPVNLDDAEVAELQSVFAAYRARGSE